MKIASAAFALLLLAGTALADDVPKPDFTRDGIERALAVDLYQPPEPRPFDWQSMFMLDWSALGTRWHFRPMLAPIYGSVPVTTGLPTPNAFMLTGTQYAYTARTWRDERALTAERRHVERLIRKRAHIVTQ